MHVYVRGAPYSLLDRGALSELAAKNHIGRAAGVANLRRGRITRANQVAEDGIGDNLVGVWVAGRPVWRDGSPTGERPGGVVQEPRR